MMFQIDLEELGIETVAQFKEAIEKLHADPEFQKVPKDLQEAAFKGSYWALACNILWDGPTERPYRQENEHPASDLQARVQELRGDPEWEGIPVAVRDDLIRKEYFYVVEERFRLAYKAEKIRKPRTKKEPTEKKK